MTDRPWTTDPALAGKLHPDYPDDVQILVHDGEPRRVDRLGELCWVRITGVEETPRRVYVGMLLNQPHELRSVRQRDTVRFVADAGGEHPLLMVTEAYLAERAGWEIRPCSGCGLAEGLDPPTVMWRTRFPKVDAVPVSFTAHCPACGGTQLLRRVGT